MQEITITLKFKSGVHIPSDLLDQLSGYVEVRTEVACSPGHED